MTASPFFEDALPNASPGKAQSPGKWGHTISIFYFRSAGEGPRQDVIRERARSAPATSRASPTAGTLAGAKRFAPPTGLRNIAVPPLCPAADCGSPGCVMLRPEPRPRQAFPPKLQGRPAFDPLQASASLFCSVGAGIVHQHPPHHVSRHTDKVLAAVPVSILSRQSKVGLVDQGCCLQRMIGSLIPHVRTGQPMQFSIDQWQQFVRRLGVALDIAFRSLVTWPSRFPWNRPPLHLCIIYRHGFDST